MEQAFYDVTVASFRARVLTAPGPREDSGNSSLTGSAIFDAIAAPFVEAFLPHFRNDPTFGRDNIDTALQHIGLPEQCAIDANLIASMLRLPGCFGAMINPTSVAVDPEVQPSAADAAATVRLRAACRKQQIFLNEPALCSDGAAEKADADTWGILISGRDGGDYQVAAGAKSCIGQGGEGCDHRLYVSSEDWDALIAGDDDLDELLAQGRLLVECDIAAPTTGKAARNRLAELIRQLQQDFGMPSHADHLLLATGKGA
jgi:hypothetical protein